MAISFVKPIFNQDRICRIRKSEVIRGKTVVLKPFVLIKWNNFFFKKASYSHSVFIPFHSFLHRWRLTNANLHLPFTQALCKNRDTSWTWNKGNTLKYRWCYERLRSRALWSCRSCRVRSPARVNFETGWRVSPIAHW